MKDVIYTEGFPDGWKMVHREDCTLLMRTSFMAIAGSECVAAAPRLMQGEAWLSLAREIANAVEGKWGAERDHSFATFCDKCGIGPNCGEDGMPLPNVRAERTWTCDYCDHENIRPLTDNKEESSGA